MSRRVIVSSDSSPIQLKRVSKRRLKKPKPTLELQDDIIDDDFEDIPKPKCKKTNDGRLWIDKYAPLHEVI